MQFIKRIFKNIFQQAKVICWEFFNYAILKKIKKASLTDLTLLSYEIPYLITNELFKTNDFYTQAKTLKKYCGLSDKYKLKCVIEHAAKWSEDVWENDIKNDLPCVISMSETRKKVFEKYCDKKHFAIGPYIAYANNFLSEEDIKNEKKRLGKTLLVFPMHSYLNSEIKYDSTELIKKINNFSKNYNTVRVCLYYMDIQYGLQKPYQNAGFECVSAGHIYGENFLSRLKSIIELSDMTMSFGYGSSLGYCIYMNKPHCLLKQTWSFDPSVTMKDALEEDKLNKNMIERENVFNLFGEFEEIIKPEQYNFVDKYWGISHLKTKEELRVIFDECEKMYKK